MTTKSVNAFRAVGLALACAVVIGTRAEVPGASESLPRIGAPFRAPDFELPGEDGRRYRLSEFRGKVVVLNFWATWCPPCRYEMPSMERARQKVAGEKIVILAVNVGEDEDTVFGFLARYPVQFPLLLDRRAEVIKLYPVVGLPTTYVIDPSGLVTHRAVGSREWDDPELLDQLRALVGPKGVCD
jgi:peroxiredoxin